MEDWEFGLDVEYLKKIKPHNSTKHVTLAKLI